MYPTSEIRIGMLLVLTVIHVVLLHRRVKKLGHPISQKEAVIRSVIYLVLAITLEFIWAIFIAP